MAECSEKQCETKQCEIGKEFYDVANIMELKECDPCAWACLCDGAAKLVRATEAAFSGDAENGWEKAMQVSVWCGEMDHIRSVYAVATQAYRYVTGKNLFYKITDYRSWHVQLAIAVALYRDTKRLYTPRISELVVNYNKKI